MNSEELLDSGDSSDEDYVPNKNDENVSEVESDGDPEDDPTFEEEETVKSRKRAKHRTKARKKQKSAEPEENTNNDSSSKEISEEEKKKKEEDLWADFMKDTGFKSKKDILNSNVNTNKTAKSPSTETPKNDNLKSKENTPKEITQVFEFAGEQVVVKKQIKEEPNACKISTAPTRSKKASGGGISGILSQIGKKQKITTLEKSKLDWDQFKKEENLDEELQNYNKGKDGYLERQDFLQRADLRRFEIEKEIRTIERNKRVN